MKKRILVIDDDHDLAKLVETILQSEECDVYHAYSGIDGLKQTYEVRPDLIVLDIMMPDMDGFAVCARLREMVNTPILMMTALANEKVMLRGFDVGVDDFLKKPFSSSELRARVYALLRRSTIQTLNDTSHITAYKDPLLNIDLSLQIVKLLGRVIELSPKEFGLLTCLIRQQGRVMSHYELVREVWGDSYVDSKSITSLYIYYLRKKIQDGKHGHQYIRTFWGRGYWFAPWKEEEHQQTNQE